MIAALFKKELKTNYKLVIIIAAVLTLYQTVITSMYDPSLGEILKQFAEQMPQMMSLFGMNNLATNLTEFYASYLYGFLLVVFPLIFSIILANRLVAKYVDNGSMSYLISSGRKRINIVLTQAVFMIFCLCLLQIFVSVLGICVSSIMYPDELDIGRYLLLNLSCLCLNLMISGICFFASCVFSDIKYSYMFGAGIPVAMYLLQMLSNLKGKLEFLKYFTLFSLFDPIAISAGKSDGVLYSAIALAVALILYTLSIIVFNKKDICV